MENTLGPNFARSNRQSGVTLLLAILVLSAIMAISFSLATIIFIEVRTSGDLVRTEGAIFGADAVSEQVLFKVKRKTNDFFPSTISLKNNVLVDKPVENTTTTPVFDDTVLTTANVFTQGKVYQLFDPSNQGGGSGFAKIRISYIDSGNTQPLEVYVCEFDPTGNASYASPVCTDPSSTEYWINQLDSVIAGAASQKYALLYPPTLGTGMEEWLLDKNKQQQLVIVNNSTAVIPIKIETFGPDVSTPKAMPLVGEVSVPVKADNSGAVRRIELRIPNQ